MKLFSWLAPFKSQIFAMVGVIAVAGIGASIIAYVHIQSQRETIKAQDDRIGDLVTINKDWSTWARQQQRLRNLEQRNVLLLQDQLAAIEARSAEQSEQLKALEASNAEVKEFLGRRIPDDLRRLLEQ